MEVREGIYALDYQNSINFMAFLRLIIIFLAANCMQASDASSSSQSEPTPLPFTLPSPTHYPAGEFRSVLPILRRLACQSSGSLKLPVMRVLAAVARLFQLSHIQALFLGYLLRETEWAVRDPVVLRHSPVVRDILYTYVCDHPDFKNLVLYLTLACFSIKESLSDSGGQFQPMASCICPSFDEAYAEWSVRYAGYTSRIRPQMINRLHRELTRSHPHPQDYNSVVDEIIAISDQYDYERRLRRVLAQRIKQGRMEQANNTPTPLPEKKETEPANEKPTGKLEFQFQSKFFSHFAEDNLMELVNVGTTNDVEEEFMLSPEDERAIGCFRGHSDPLSEDEECQEANLPPFYDERHLFLPPPEELSRELELASISESNFGLFALHRDYEDFP